MGKPTGFLEYERETSIEIAPEERIKNFNEFHIPLSLEEQKIQAARCMDCGVPFCQAGMMIGGMASGCPLNNLIPEWNDMIYNDNWEHAYARLSKTNNFPEFTSRVCPALCEKACTCNINGDPVSVRENERAIIEYAYANGLVNDQPPKGKTDKKVAVIGSGPSGLAVADMLNSRGHDVTVYERSDRPGGLLMYGIPNMKLEKEVIDRKIAYMEKRGIRFILNTEVAIGKSTAKSPYPKDDQITGYLKNPNQKYVKAEDLLKEYDAVVLACGASNPRDIKAAGRDAKGIYFAVDFLKTEIERTAAMGSKTLVLHPGSHVNAGADAGIASIIKGLNEVLTKDTPVHIALETMAGKGSEIGRSFEELAHIYDGVTYNDKLRVCFDTCHTNDAGYDVANDFDSVIEEFDKIIGKDQIAVFHINDSKNPRGAAKDRHENIGLGSIGFDALYKVVWHKDFLDVPKILETPYVKSLADAKKAFPPYKEEIDMLRSGAYDAARITKLAE